MVLDIRRNAFKAYGELDLPFVDKTKITRWNFTKFETFIPFKEGVTNETLPEKVANLVDLDNKEANFTFKWMKDLRDFSCNKN